MDRRIFLKAAGVGLLHPPGLLAVGPALVRQGNRRLKDITPDELMELLIWAKIDVEEVTTVEDMERERLPDQDDDKQQEHRCDRGAGDR